jgi:hypothetical protein
MCYNAILPTTLPAEQFGNELTNLTYIFNRWLKMLTSYGKLDESGLDDDFTAIAKVVKADGVKKDIKRAVQRCRDYALSEFAKIEDLIRSLTTALKVLCKAQDNPAVKQIKKSYADQGMTEKYRPLTKRLAREKIRKIGREVTFTDWHTDDKETTKLVRRFVEKRAAQAVHKNTHKRDRETNRYRQSVRRATSFSLYSKRYTDYDAQLRAPGTHWKVVKQTCKGKKVLAAKFSYNSYEEAVEACNRYMMNHPNDLRPMSAYKCDCCGKWHIGHERVEISEIEEFIDNIEKIA